MQPWTLLDQTLEFSASPWVNVYREKVQLPNGTVVEDYYRVKLSPSVLIVPITPDGDLVMVRGYRHGIGKITLSAPAGMIDAGETPLHAAKRELLEETGYATSS